jgi:hypothetical protein
MLRLFHDLSGDAAVAERVEREQNFDKRSQMLFYLAHYYDIRGSKTLADRYFLMVHDMDRRGTVEWRLNNWIIEQRGLR